MQSSMCNVYGAFRSHKTSIQKIIAYSAIVMGILAVVLQLGSLVHTVVATSTCTSLKPAISPSNVAQNANPGAVLDSARPENSKTPLTC